MSKIVKTIGNRSITVVTADSFGADITSTDAEMDKRAKAAVSSAISKAKICKKPIARYDRLRCRAYIEMADGEKRYV